MERLTKCDIDGCLIHPWSFNGINGSYDIWDEELLEKQIDRLSAYEDSGLEPEEIADFMKRWEQAVEIGGMLKKYGIDHIWDIIQAEQDGRLVVLPCKVGDTIYYTREGYPIVEPLKVRTFFVGEPTRRGEILHLHMIRTDKFDVSMDAIGKTVFLTRDEAEAALKGGEV